MSSFRGGQWVASKNGGLRGTVYALEVNTSRNLVLVGGSFTETDDRAVTQLGSLAEFNLGLNQWEPMTFQGVNGSVYAIENKGGRVFIGGKFSASGGGDRTDLGNIAEVSTGTLLRLENGGLSGPVNALLFDAGVLYVGGEFSLGRRNDS